METYFAYCCHYVNSAYVPGSVWECDTSENMKSDRQIYIPIGDDNGALNTGEDIISNKS